MPVVEYKLTPGLTRDQKREIVAETTALLARVLGKRPEHTHVLITEIPEENWGFAGLLTDEWRADLEA